MKNILIIGCGLLGSSLLRRIAKKSIANKIFIYEKSKSNIAKIKKLKLPGTFVRSLKEGTINSDFIIFCTPMSEYKKIILKINNYIRPKTLVTDIGSSKIETSKIIKKYFKKGQHWIQSHPIAGSEVSGPENGKENIFVNRWCIIINDKDISPPKPNSPPSANCVEVLCIAIELFTFFKNFFADFIFLVIIASVCIVPYSLI